MNVGQSDTMAIVLKFWKLIDGENSLNLPGTPNTSSEYYMEYAVCANDCFEKKK